MLNLIKNPPLPLLGSQHTSFSQGFTTSTIKFTTLRGVKNCPNSPRNAVPKNFSNAMPLMSADVSDRL